MASVVRVVGLIESLGYSRPKDLGEWYQSSMPQLGHFEGGIEYFKHGSGISVRLPDSPIEFDFGPEGEVDHLDRHFLLQYILRVEGAFGFESEAELTRAFDDAVGEGALVQVSRSAYRLT